MATAQQTNKPIDIPTSPTPPDLTDSMDLNNQLPEIEHLDNTTNRTAFGPTDIQLPAPIIELQEKVDQQHHAIIQENQMEVQQGSKSFSKFHPKNPTTPIDLQKNDDQQHDIQHTFVPGNIDK